MNRNYPTWVWDLSKFITGKCIATFSVEMIFIAIGWQVYDLTHNPMNLGLIGLAQFLPFLILSLWGGQAADRYSRKKLALAGLTLGLLAVILMVLQSIYASTQLFLIYLALVILGVSKAVSSPAMHAVMPSLVPAEKFSQVAAWNASLWQLMVILGPTTGGFLLAYFGSPTKVYLTGMVLLLIATLFINRTNIPHAVSSTTESFVENCLAGFRYVKKHEEILGAISLDLFAVLFGGVIALLPAFASDVLKVGPEGLGILKGAQGFGAAAMSVYLGINPIRAKAGKKLFIAVFTFGFAILGFGLSTNFYLSIVCLVLAGAADAISIVVRHGLVQLRTPPEMRGRVSAVSVICISASNELGEFESGFAASFFGLVPSVIIGGVGTLVVAGIWMFTFPRLRKADTLESKT